jgi:hypothetical protein
MEFRVVYRVLMLTAKFYVADYGLRSAADVQKHAADILAHEAKHHQLDTGKIIMITASDDQPGTSIP